MDPQSLPSRHLTLCTVREPCDGWGGAARGCGSTQPGVRGGRLWLVQKFKTPLKVTLGSNHTHPYSEKGPRS